MAHTTNHVAIRLRQRWETQKLLGRPFDLAEETKSLLSASPLDSTAVSLLERWSADWWARGQQERAQALERWMAEG